MDILDLSECHVFFARHWPWAGVKEGRDKGQRRRRRRRRVGGRHTSHVVFHSSRSRESQRGRIGNKGCVSPHLPVCVSTLRADPHQSPARSALTTEACVSQDKYRKHMFYGAKSTVSFRPSDFTHIISPFLTANGPKHAFYGAKSSLSFRNRDFTCIISLC